jgi:hypothetical protein
MRILFPRFLSRRNDRPEDSRRALCAFAIPVLYRIIITLPASRELINSRVTPALLNLVANCSAVPYLENVPRSPEVMREVTRKSHLTNRSCMYRWLLLSASNAVKMRSPSLSLYTAHAQVCRRACTFIACGYIARVHTRMYILQVGIMGSCASCGSRRRPA